MHVFGDRWLKFPLGPAGLFHFLPQPLLADSRALHFFLIWNPLKQLGFALFRPMPTNSDWKKECWPKLGGSGMIREEMRR